MKNSDYMESERLYRDRDIARFFDIIHYLGEEWIGWGDGDKDRGRFLGQIAAYNRRYKKKITI